MADEKFSGFVFYDKEGIPFSKNENELISENIRRILMTRRGERVNNLAFGSDLKRYIFLPGITANDLISEMKNSITRCEPRVTVESCTLSKSELQEDILNVNLIIRIKSSGELEALTVSV